MTKPIFLFLSLCVGSIGFGALHRATNQIRTAASIRHEQWQAASKGLAATRAAMLAAQAEVLDKRNRLLQARRHPALSPELLLLLEKDGFTGHSAAWAELRQQLGIGWDTSPDYVLVRKQVLKQLNYPSALLRFPRQRLYVRPLRPLAGRAISHRGSPRRIQRRAVTDRSTGGASRGRCRALYHASG